MAGSMDMKSGSRIPIAEVLTNLYLQNGSEAPASRTVILIRRILMKAKWVDRQNHGSYRVDTKSEIELLFRCYDPDQSIKRRDIGAIWKNHFNYLVLFALKDFFQPKTVLIGGEVFLRSPGRNAESDADFAQARLALLEQEDYKANIENYNWFEPLYEFGPLYDWQVISDDDDEILDQSTAEILRDSWDLWLHHSYKDRKFQVTTIHPDETGGLWGVGFKEID
jgi:hypothetical protein